MLRRAILIVAVIGCSSKKHPVDASDAYDVTVHWILQDAAGQPQPCPVGFSTVQVVVVSAQSAPPVATPFPCDNRLGTVTIDPAPNDSYGVKVRITDGPFGAAFGESPPTPATPGGDVTLRVITDRGRLDVHWTVSQGGAPKTCQDVGSPQVQVQVTPAGGQPMTQMADCATMQALTPEIPTGTANVVLTAGASTGMQANVTVPTGELTAEVPAIDLAF